MSCLGWQILCPNSNFKESMSLLNFISYTGFFLLSVSVCHSQNITGYVFDQETMLPIEGVNVYTKDKKYGSSSLEDGKFSFIQKGSTDSIFFSHISYKTKELAISALVNKKNDRVYLEPKEEELKEVLVSSTRKLEKRILASNISHMKLPMYSFGSVLVNGKIFVIGGDLSMRDDGFIKGMQEAAMNGQGDASPYGDSRSNFKWDAYSGKLQIYDIKLDKWTFSDTKFMKRAYHALCAYKGKIYVIGGKSLSPNGTVEYLVRQIEVYDTYNDSVVVDQTNPHEAADLTALNYGDNIIVIGGANKLLKNGEKQYLNMLSLFNVSTGLWYDLGNFPFSSEVSASIVGHKIYLITWGDDIPVKSMYTYDLLSGKWERVCNLLTSPKVRPAMTQGNGILYIYETRSFTVLDPVKKELKKYWTDLTVEEPNIHYYKERIYVIGGKQSDDYSSIPKSKMYSVDVRDFKNTAPIEVQGFSEK